MDFHPDVSIMSAAWLENKIKLCLLNSTFQNISFKKKSYKFQNVLNTLPHSVIKPCAFMKIPSLPYWYLLL